mmetsp:Transcript_1925/g.3936  ORF Transcript_1925/g.3936 Transcript_1925/m.3936 type:complete len:235 (-) Transcript_1925:1421-2125(-)
MQRLIQLYSKNLQRRPFTTQIVSSAVLWGIGDVLAQRVSSDDAQHHGSPSSSTAVSVEQQQQGQRREKTHGSSASDMDGIVPSNALDIRRALSASLYGGLFNGTIGHIWYTKLDELALAFLKHKSPFVFIGAKVFADSIVFGPLHLGAYFTCMTLMEGGSLRDVQHKMEKDFVPTFAVELTMWPLVQAINFALVPVTYQLLVVNCATVVDAGLLSWIQHQVDFSGRVKAFIHGS